MDFDIKDAVYTAISKTQKKDEPQGEVSPVQGLYGCGPTYRCGDYWVCIQGEEAIDPRWTPLHRAFYGCDQMFRFNKATVEEKLHMPLSIPVGVVPPEKEFFRARYVSRAIEGAPMIHHVVKHGFDKLDPTVPEQIGRFMTRLHSLKTEGTGLFAITEAGIFPGPWLKYFPIVTKAFFDEIEGKGLLDDDLLSSIRAIFEANYKIGLLNEVVALAHNQYSPLNLWFDENLKRMTGVLNWERSGSGTTFSDFISWKLWCWDEDFFEEILKGYEALKSRPDKFDEKLQFYLMINGLQMAVFAAKQKQENNKNYFLRQALLGAASYDESFKAKADALGSYSRMTFAS